jgi:hypothetical protein
MSGRNLVRSRVGVALAACLIAGAIGACTTTGSGGTAGNPGTAGTGPTGSATDPVRNGCGDALAEVIGWTDYAMASAACATPEALAPGSPWPIGIRDAATSMRTFTGETTLQFEVSGPTAGFGHREYSLNSDGMAGGYYIGGTVDADSGRVTSVYYTARVNGPGRVAISADTAVVIAREYLAAHKVNVGTLEVSTAKDFDAYEVTFEALANGVGVLPRVTVQVNWTSSKVASFSDERGTFGPPPAPSISHDAAVTSAKAQAGLVDPTLEGARLRVDFAGDGRQILVWVIYLSGKQDPSEPDAGYYKVRIDGLTGQPL